MPVHVKGTRYFSYTEGRTLGKLFNADEHGYVGDKNGHAYTFYDYLNKRKDAEYIHGLLIMLDIECELRIEGNYIIVQLLNEDHDRNVHKLHKLLEDLEREANDSEQQ